MPISKDICNLMHQRKLNTNLNAIKCKLKLHFKPEPIILNLTANKILSVEKIKTKTQIQNRPEIETRNN